MHTQRPTRYRRYLAVFCASVAIGVGVLAGFNYTVDPYRVFHGHDGSPIDQATPFYSKRAAKMKRLRAGDWQVVIVGSSRAQVGFDPSLPASDGLRLYNAGLNGAGIVEITATAHYALAHNPGLETLVLVLDPAYFSPQQEEAAVFPTGPHHPAYDPFDRTVGMLLGMEATGDAFRALSAKGDGGPQRVTPLGYRAASLNRSHTPWAEVFEATLQEFYPRPEGLIEPGHFTPLRELLAEARESEVEVVLMIAPSHASRWERLEAAGHWQEIELVKHELVVIADEAGRGDGPTVTLYDFARVLPETTVPVLSDSAEDEAMPHFWDPVHFRTSLGERMLMQALRGATAERLGVVITPANIEAHLAEERTALNHYLEGVSPTPE